MDSTSQRPATPPTTFRDLWLMPEEERTAAAVPVLQHQCQHNPWILVNEIIHRGTDEETIRGAVFALTMPGASECLLQYGGIRLAKRVVWRLYDLRKHFRLRPRIREQIAAALNTLCLAQEMLSEEHFALGAQRAVSHWMNREGDSAISEVLRDLHRCLNYHVKPTLAAVISAASCLCI